MTLVLPLRRDERLAYSQIRVALLPRPYSDHEGDMTSPGSWLLDGSSCDRQGGDVALLWPEVRTSTWPSLRVLKDMKLQRGAEFNALLTSCCCCNR